jgi:hypothetical protein
MDTIQPRQINSDYGIISLRPVPVESVQTICATNGKLCSYVADIVWSETHIAGLHVHTLDENLPKYFIFSLYVLDLERTYAEAPFKYAKSHGPYDSPDAAAVAACEKHNQFLQAEQSKREMDRAKKDAAVDAVQQALDLFNKK